MSATTTSNSTVGVLDYRTALEALKEYPRDGLDVRSLLDSDKRGGLT